MRKRYCYWSVATGPYAALMERCVASARRSGVFKEFHVLTDRPIAGCDSYDAQSVEGMEGMFKLIYLKAGMAKLPFDYFIWVDADTVFVRNPQGILGCFGKAPIHVPLTTNLGTLGEDRPLNELSTRQYMGLMAGAGVYNSVYLNGSAFWIVQREAIGRVVELATYFRSFATEKGFKLDVSACLGYAMQMLCANPEAHRVSERPDLWASDDQNWLEGRMFDGEPWPARDMLNDEDVEVRPAIIHVPCSKEVDVQKVANYGAEAQVTNAISWR